jgi:hypothetical protein
MAQHILDAEIVEQDELGKEIKENALNQMMSEIESYTKAKEQAQKELTRFESQCVRDLEKFELMMKDFVYVAEPKFAFEKNPRYWELVKDEKTDEIQMEKAKMDGYKERKKKEIEEFQKIINTTQKRYDELKAQE